MAHAVQRNLVNMTRLEQFAAFHGVDSCQTKV